MGELYLFPYLLFGGAVTLQHGFGVEYRVYERVGTFKVAALDTYVYFPVYRVHFVVVGACVSFGHISNERQVFFVVVLQGAYLPAVLLGGHLPLLHLLLQLLEPLLVVLLGHAVGVVLDALLVGLELFEVHHYYLNGYLRRKHQFAPYEAFVLQLVAVLSDALQDKCIAVAFVGCRYAEYSIL